VVTAIICFIFYTIYISAGLYGVGISVEKLFNIPYGFGVIAGVIIIVPYLYIGGYKTLAWIDLFQALFLLLVILFVPLYIIPKIGGINTLYDSLNSYGRTNALIPNFAPSTFLAIFYSLCTWGLGYFGQPHIITKFMGINDPKKLKKSMFVGVSWQIITLACASLVGLAAIIYFNGTLSDPEKAFIIIVKDTFSSYLSALILCGVIAATISTLDTQILVLASSITEDFYKRLINKNASQKHLLIISKFSVLVVALFSFIIAYLQIGTIYSLVLYAWSGLGCSFGPVLLFALYSKKATKYGAWVGIIIGGTISIFWNFIPYAPLKNIPTLVAGFTLSTIGIYLTSKMSSLKRNHAID